MGSQNMGTFVSEKMAKPPLGGGCCVKKIFDFLNSPLGGGLPTPSEATALWPIGLLSFMQSTSEGTFDFVLCVA